MAGRGVNSHFVSKPVPSLDVVPGPTSSFPKGVVEEFSDESSVGTAVCDVGKGRRVSSSACLIFDGTGVDAFVVGVRDGTDVGVRETEACEFPIDEMGSIEDGLALLGTLVVCLDGIGEVDGFSVTLFASTTNGDFVGCAETVVVGSVLGAEGTFAEGRAEEITEGTFEVEPVVVLDCDGEEDNETGEECSEALVNESIVEGYIEGLAGGIKEGSKAVGLGREDCDDPTDLSLICFFA